MGLFVHNKNEMRELEGKLSLYIFGNKVFYKEKCIGLLGHILLIVDGEKYTLREVIWVKEGEEQSFEDELMRLLPQCLQTEFTVPSKKIDKYILQPLDIYVSIEVSDEEIIIDHKKLQSII